MATGKFMRIPVDESNKDSAESDKGLAVPGESLDASGARLERVPTVKWTVEEASSGDGEELLKTPAPFACNILHSFVCTLFVFM